MSSKSVLLRVGNAKLNLRGSDIKTLYVSGDTFTYNRELGTFQSAKALADEARRLRIAFEEEERRQRIAAEAPRRGRVRLENSTPKSVDIVVTGFRDPEGNYTEQVDAEIGQIWTIPPRKALYITGFGRDLVTSKISCVTKTRRAWNRRRQPTASRATTSI